LDFHNSSVNERSTSSVDLSLMDSEKVVNKDRPLLKAYREELRKSRMAAHQLATAPKQDLKRHLASANEVPKFVGISSSTKAG
jgi:hypothetical protein